MTGALAPLRHRDFRLLFIGLVAGRGMMPLQFIAQIFWIQSEAPAELRVLLVGSLAAVRGAAALVFGLAGGALADRFDRRPLLVVTQWASLGANAGVVAVMAVGEGDLPGVTAFLALTFVASALMAIDIPARQALVPELLGPALTPGGYSLNTAGMQLSLPVSMLASGFAIDALGLAGAYAAGASGHIAQIATLAAMRYRAEPAAGGTARAAGARRTLADVRDGLRFVRREPTVLWVIALVLLVGGMGAPAVANLGPTWITTVVGVDVRDFGLVAMTWGLGAFLGSAVLAQRAATLRRWGLIVAWSSLLFAGSFIVFSIATVPTAVIGNFGLGTGLAVSNVAAVAIVQHLVPNAVRGRVMSVLTLNQGLAQLLTLPLAAAGQLLSLRVLFPALAVLQLACVTALVVSRPVVRRARIDLEPAPEPGAAQPVTGASPPRAAVGEPSPPGGGDA